jgi:hypothetical protein
MTNAQVRLLSSAVALLAGGVMVSTSNVSVNIGLAVIILSAAIFAAEYWRSFKS